MKDLSKISCNYSLNAQITVLEIDDTVAGQRIDNFLFKICKGVPKSHIYCILRSGEVRVNKRRVRADYRLCLNDQIRIPPIRLSSPKRVDVPKGNFEIIYEDQVMIAINKPAGVAVHGGSGVDFGVIEQMRQSHPQARFLELVHRLDKETSGVLLLAKKRSALVKMHEMMRENLMDKRYYACVVGHWPDEWGKRRIVKSALRKFLTNAGERRVVVDENGVSAYTVFNVMQVWPDFAWLEAELKTGRTHQIRVHLASLGLPIVGDDKYGDFELNRKLARRKHPPKLARMFLHAYRLTLAHPVTGEPLCLQAPLPAVCQQFIDALNDRDDESELFF